MGHYIGEVVGIQRYANDLVVVRRGIQPAGPIETRGEITEFSRKSRQRLAFIASNTLVEFTTMITLTYPGEFESNGQVVKGHLRKFLYEMRKERPSVNYIWVLEWQKRGAPHFQLVTDWALPR
jgi:hypothetical protein